MKASRHLDRARTETSATLRTATLAGVNTRLRAPLLHPAKRSVGAVRARLLVRWMGDTGRWRVHVRRGQSRSTWERQVLGDRRGVPPDEAPRAVHGLVATSLTLLSELVVSRAHLDGGRYERLESQPGRRRLLEVARL
jgi:hypothetical protein